MAYFVTDRSIPGYWKIDQEAFIMCAAESLGATPNWPFVMEMVRVFKNHRKDLDASLDFVKDRYSKALKRLEVPDDIIMDLIMAIKKEHLTNYRKDRRMALIRYHSSLGKESLLYAIAEKHDELDQKLLDWCAEILDAREAHTDAAIDFLREEIKSYLRPLRSEPSKDPEEACSSYCQRMEEFMAEFQKIFEHYQAEMLERSEKTEEEKCEDFLKGVFSFSSLIRALVPPAPMSTWEYQRTIPLRRAKVVEIFYKYFGESADPNLLAECLNAIEGPREGAGPTFTVESAAQFYALMKKDHQLLPKASL